MPGGVITTGSNPKLLWPGLKLVFGIAYKEHPETWSKMFTRVPSDKAYEEYLTYVGTGLAQVKPQGESIAYDSMQQGFTTRLTNVTVGIGAICTEEEQEDNLYPQIAKGRMRALVFSMKQYKEQYMASFYNHAFTSGYNGGDGVVLCSTAHPNVAGGTYANTPATAADLSEVALEDGLIAIAGLQDDKGLFVNVQAKKLLCSRQDFYNAVRIVHSTYQSGTANNDINAIKYEGSLPDGIVQSVYFTAPHTWFILTDAGGQGYGMIYQERRAARPFEDNDADTFNYKFGISERYVGGWDNPRVVWGNPGP
jgi:hypothetical protein